MNGTSFFQLSTSHREINLSYRTAGLDLPRCSSSPNTSKSNVSFNEISQILGLQVHRITSLHQTNTDTLFDCPVEADPEPLEVAWSYVPLDELTRDPDTLVEQSNLSAQRGEVISKATRLSRDEIISISGRNSPLSRGLLMCRSRNKLGWQHQKACINLLLHTSGKPMPLPLSYPNQLMCGQPARILGRILTRICLVQSVCSCALLD